MKPMQVGALLLTAGVMSACEPKVTSTFVTGSVHGVTLPEATAISVIDKDLLGQRRETVWLGQGDICRLQTTARPGFLMVDLGPSHIRSPDGGALPALIVRGHAAWFDTGDGGERLSGTGNLRILDTSDGVLKGRFTATFGPDAGPLETMTGDFIATGCQTATSGCSSLGGTGFLSMLPLVALLIARRRSTSA